MSRSHLPISQRRPTKTKAITEILVKSSSSPLNTAQESDGWLTVKYKKGKKTTSAKNVASSSTDIVVVQSIQSNEMKKPNDKKAIGLPHSAAKSSPGKTNKYHLLTATELMELPKNYVPGKPQSTKCSQKNQRRNARKCERRRLLQEKELETAVVSAPDEDVHEKRDVEQQKNVTGYCRLLQLPYVVLTEGVLSYLRHEDMALLGACNKYSKTISEDGYLWQTMFRLRFPQSQLSPKAMKQWKLVYQLSLSKVVDRLRCFITNKTFFEDVLGVGIGFTVNPRTNNVDYISMSQDLLSKTAFEQHHIWSDAFGNSFQLFLPLYFTEEHFQRALTLIRHTIVKLASSSGRKSDPYTCAVYAKEHNLLNTPGWNLLKRHARTARRLIRTLKKSKYRQARASRKYKHGWELQRDYAHALHFDIHNGNNKWKEAIDLEIEQIKEYQVFTDVGNEYLQALTREKLNIVGGPEFEKLQGHVLVMYKTLYGTRSGGACWHDKFFDILHHMGFKISEVDWGGHDPNPNHGNESLPSEVDWGAHNPDTDDPEQLTGESIQSFLTFVVQLQWFVALGRLHLHKSLPCPSLW